MGVPIGDIIPRRKVEINELGKVAVDAHNAIYQFLSIIRQRDGTPLMDSRGGVTSHLSGLFYRNANLIESGVKLIYVFDGAPPALKKDTLTDRREIREHAEQMWVEAKAKGMPEAFKYAQASSKINEDIIESSKQLLSYMGIPTVQAPSEGEAQASYMTMKGDARYTGSQDFDSLLFGAPRLVRNLTITGKRKLPGKNVYVTVTPESIELSDVLESLEITREQLIEIGILVGTDFNKGVKGIGPKKALKLVKDNGIESVLELLDEHMNYERVKQFFLHPDVTDDYKLKWNMPDDDHIAEFLCDQHDFSRERVEKVVEKLSTAYHSSSQMSLSRWF
ncbi:MAG TPA: flap endonuclease-1 [Candidatus Acidoferrales bacterium]|nr:flap endonuclease-1 [Candidatus Acidoferrales bacterium]